MQDPFTPLDDITLALAEHGEIVDMILNISKDQLTAAIRLLAEYGVPPEEIREKLITPFQPRFDEVNARLDAGSVMFAKKRPPGWN